MQIEVGNKSRLRLVLALHPAYIRPIPDAIITEMLLTLAGFNLHDALSEGDDFILIGCVVDVTRGYVKARLARRFYFTPRHLASLASH